MNKKLINLFLSSSILYQGTCISVTATELELKETVETSSNTPIYCLYNANSGEHLYTGDPNERKYLAYHGWKDEGAKWMSPSLSNIPIYRLYNPNTGDHHYTTDTQEVTTLVNIGWRNEGFKFYSASTSGTPIYRLYNPRTKALGSHHYTGNRNEANMLITVGWNYEGIGWYSTGEDVPKDIIEPTPSPSSLTQEVLKSAARDYYQGGFNADVHFGLRLSEDGTFLAEEQFFLVDPPAGGYAISPYTGSFKDITQVSEHVYSAIVKDIQPSNNLFYKKYQGTEMKIEYTFNPQFFANDYKVYIFTPNTTATELKTYAPQLNFSDGFDYYISYPEHWMIYTQYGKEILVNKKGS